MIQLLKKSDCCGCLACVQRCPQKCITLKEDEEGFFYPKIDLETCTNCGVCERICPIINQTEKRQPSAIFAAKNKNKGVQKQSSSGGIFTLLAEEVIKNKGVVFGARFDKNWDVKHDFVESVDDLKYFRGSKYVESFIGDSYIKVEKFLKADRKVLFSGTPCQTAGLKLFLKREYDNLLTVDFICHGIPSPKVWRLYLNSLMAERREDYNDLNSVITDISFRNKVNGWKQYSFYMTFTKAKPYIERFDKNIYMKGFLNDFYLRPSCYACNFKSFRSKSDITLADYWGVGDRYPDFNDDNGVSLIFIHNSKKINKSALDKTCDMISVEKNKVTQYSIKNSAKRPWQRNLFFQLYDKYPLPTIINFFIGLNWTNWIVLKRAIGLVLRKVGVWKLIRK